MWIVRSSSRFLVWACAVGCGSGLGACKERAAEVGGGEPVTRVRVAKGELLASFGARVTAAARGVDGLFAVGTAKGGVLVDRGAKRFRLLADMGKRGSAELDGGPSNPASRPVAANHDGPISGLEI